MRTAWFFGGTHTVGEHAISVLSENVGDAPFEIEIGRGAP
jgi:hypothetical protein